MSLIGEFKNATITILSDDDLTAAVDLGRGYDFMIIHIPPIDSANLTIYGAERTASTYYALGNSLTVTAGTGGFAEVVKIGGHRFIKIGTSAAQTANRTFRVCGIAL